MATLVHDTLIQNKDDKGNIHINYPVTKYKNVLDAPVVYQALTDIASNITESTSMLDIFNAMATPSRLACNISNGSTSVYPASSGTLAINKTGSATGTAMFMDAYGRVSTAVFTENPTGGGVLLSEWKCVEQDIEGMCNPNLLINTDFTNPVNQRGQSEYTGVGYTIDMWRVTSSDGTGTVTLKSGGITLAYNGSGVLDFSQGVENSVEGLVTFSAKINGEIYTLTFKVGTIDVTKFGPVQFYSLDKSCVIRLSNIAVDIQAVKLELGTVSTLKNEIVNYAEQLRKCQRYYYKVPEWELIETPCVLQCANHKTNNLQGNIYYPEKMRIKPTISNIKARSMADGQIGTIDQYLIAGCESGFNAIYEVVSDMVFTSGAHYTVTFEASAEL